MTRAPIFATATAQLAALAAGELSSVELLDAELAQIAAHGWVNAIVTVDAQAARRAAQDADRARAVARAGSRPGGGLGPLHGLPVTVKHDLEVAGMRSTYGAAATRDHVPARDAESVARLRRAGAIVFGRSNLPEYARDGQSYNELHGTTANPWDPARTPGGSSGGAAAALAAGMTSLELGSDLGGSIRLPASWCGVLGLKPTWGVIPTSGHVPVPGAPEGAELYCDDISVAGPLARGACDLELALDVLTAPAFQTPGWAPVLPGAPFAGHDELRAAVCPEDPRAPLQAATQAVLAEACASLAADGVTLVERRPPRSLDAIEELFETLFMAAMAMRVGDPGLETITGALRGLGGRAPLAERHLRALGLDHRQWLALERDRLRVARDWAAFFDGIDVLLCPAVARTAIAHDHSMPLELRTMEIDGTTRFLRPGLTRWCAPASLSGLPATVAPAGLSPDGLPVGLQIVAAPFRDRSTIAAAQLLERTVGPFAPPPLVAAHQPPGNAAQ